MGDFVSLATPDRRTLYVSPSFFRLTGYSADDDAYADLYVWSDSPDKYKDARIIFKDF